MVPGLANRNDHRNCKEGNSTWGGKRVKLLQNSSETWLEPGARSVMEEKSYLRNQSILSSLQANNEKKSSLLQHLLKLRKKLNLIKTLSNLRKIKNILLEFSFFALEITTMTVIFHRR
jgi:hypothetical protein